MKRILLIEDDRKLSELMHRALCGERYAVDTADSGVLAWQQMQAAPVDLIVAELQLLSDSAGRWIRQIRAVHAALPILALTDCSPLPDMLPSVSDGSFGLLIKPFGHDELLMRVRSALEPEPIPAPPVLRVADLELDRLHHRVQRAGQRIELLPSEYALLELLVCHQGRTVSRNMIMHQVWDSSYADLTDIIDVYVRHLRRKVDDPYPTKLIRSVRGSGFTIGAGS